MSERYHKLFSLPENLYATGSPVVIAAGALLKDNQTGKVLAQLKLRNISKKTIKAATVSVEPLDTVGKPLGTPVTYQYLDLHAYRNWDFGQKAAINLPDSATRSLAVSVAQVIFTDNAIWTADGQSWETLQKPVALDTLRERELIKQFRIAYGARCENLLLEQKDLWHCVCGRLNRQEEATCHKCSRMLSTLQAIDLDDLRKQRDERIAKERAEAKARRIQAEKEAEVARKEAEIARRKTVKIGTIVAAILSVVVIAAVLLTQVIIPSGKYKEAVSYMENGNYEEAIAAFEALDGYKDSVQKIRDCEASIQENAYQNAVALMNQGQYEDAIAAFEEMASYKDSTGLIADCNAAIEERHLRERYDAAEALAESSETAKAAMAFNALGDYQDARERCFALWEDIAVRDTLSARVQTVAIKNNGTVVAIGYNKYGQCNVSDWTDIVAVSAGNAHTVGLKSDGTVVAVGSNMDGQSDVFDWTDIVAISAGNSHTVGLKSDGTVVAVGDNEYGQCDVSEWTNIVAVSAGECSTFGFKSNGTVVAVGYNAYDQCEVSGWTDIVAISAGVFHTVGLKSDGTVVVTGYNMHGQCNVSDWTDIKLP